MADSKDVNYLKTLKALIKGSLVLLGLSFVFSGVVILRILNLTKELECEFNKLISIFVGIPIIFLLFIFLGFLFLMKNKSYESPDKKDEKSKNKDQIINMIGNTINILVKTIKPDSEQNVEKLMVLIKEIPEIFSNYSLEEKPKTKLISDSNNETTVSN